MQTVDELSHVRHDHLVGMAMKGIQRQGRQWSRSEVETKYRQLCPEKIELIEGKMFWTDEERLNMLALLLENVGMDAAVRLGDPALWKEAIEERLKREKGPRRVGDDAGP